MTPEEIAIAVQRIRQHRAAMEPATTEREAERLSRQFVEELEKDVGLVVRLHRLRQRLAKRWRAFNP